MVVGDVTGVSELLASDVVTSGGTVLVGSVGIVVTMLEVDGSCDVGGIVVGGVSNVVGSSDV